MSLFKANLAARLNKALGGIVFDITLIRVEQGILSEENPTAGHTQEQFEYTVRGFVDEYEERRIDGEIIQQGDRMLIILGASIPADAGEPKIEDFTTVNGEKKKIVNVRKDAAEATYECQLR